MKCIICSLLKELGAKKKTHCTQLFFPGDCVENCMKTDIRVVQPIHQLFMSLSYFGGNKQQQVTKPRSTLRSRVEIHKHFLPKYIQPY